MDSKSEAFLKGGCGCLLVFFVVAAIAVAAGGRAHIDIGGALCLFVSGGLLGLIVLAIYNRGRRDAPSNQYRDEEPNDLSSRDD